MEPDSVLVDRVKQGNAEAYEELVGRYERLARVVALRIVGDHHGAEDVAQDALVLAYRHLGSLRDGSKFGPWLMRIAKREAVRAARSRPATASIESAGEPVEPARFERNKLLDKVQRSFRDEKLQREGVGLWYSERGFRVSVDDNEGFKGLMCYADHPAMRGFTGKTAEGIGMGATREEIEKAYGEPDLAVEGDGRQLTLRYDSLGVGFLLQDGRLWWMAVRK